MMYLGTLGRMVPIKCPTTQRVTTTDRYTFSTTLGGAVKAQVGPVGKRTWDIGLGSLTTPADVGALMDFVTGGWGVGPFVFVPADAPVVNMLTPKAAACDPAALILSSGAELLGTPPMNLGEDGVAATSAWTNGVGTVQFGGPIHAPPGQQVTASAWVVGEGSIRLSFVNANGSEIGTQVSPTQNIPTPQRIWVTGTVPANAAYVRAMTTQGITQVARPAVTWTSEPYEWGDGQGCDKAIIHAASRDVTAAWDNPRTGRWSDMSFTVQEVG